MWFQGLLWVQLLIAWFKLAFFWQAYVQQLETSRIKLAQVEQELERARQQVQSDYLIGVCSNFSSFLSG